MPVTNPAAGADIGSVEAGVEDAIFNLEEVELRDSGIVV